MATTSTTLTTAEQLVPDEVWAAIQPLLPPKRPIPRAAGPGSKTGQCWAASSTSCGLVCRGLGTDQIAQALFLSPHTVRGYLKDLFAKVGVTSRGELVARLFADHYHDQLIGPATILHDPT